MRMIGETSSSNDSTQFARISPSLDLLNSIVAVIHPIDDSSNSSSSTEASSSTDYLKLLSQSNTAGFLWLVQIELEADSITFISPCPGALPSSHILVGNLKYVE